eukprot:SAG31_NODE_18731_length_624_cov_1.897143_1_plen_148_part_10
MTGSLTDMGRNVFRVSMFAASTAPRIAMVPFFAVYGFLAALAYEIGATLSPLASRERIIKHIIKIPSSTIDKPDGIVAVIPALIRTSQELRQLQDCVWSIASDNAVKDIIVVDDGSPIPVVLDACQTVRHDINSGPASARNTGITVAL